MLEALGTALAAAEPALWRWVAYHQEALWLLKDSIFTNLADTRLLRTQL